jgi:hypothetical protein
MATGAAQAFHPGSYLHHRPATATSARLERIAQLAGASARNKPCERVSKAAA